MTTTTDEKLYTLDEAKTILERRRREEHCGWQFEHRPPINSVEVGDRMEFDQSCDCGKVTWHVTITERD